MNLSCERINAVKVTGLPPEPLRRAVAVVRYELGPDMLNAPGAGHKRGHWGSMRLTGCNWWG